MRKPFSALLMPLAGLLTLPLAACGTPTTATSLSGAAVATAIGHIRPSQRDTCDTQRQIAAQSSKIAEFQTGKAATYKAAPPCDKLPAAPAQPKLPKVS